MADLDFTAITTHSLEGAPRLAQRTQAGRPLGPNASVSDFLDALPHVLAADGLRALAEAIAEARRRSKPVIMQFGGHLIKCGLGSFVIDFMERGLVTSLAVNGSVAIHDLELAMVGATSEDVAQRLEEGSFGMAREPAEFMNRAAEAGRALGLGHAIGELINSDGLRFGGESVLGRAASLGRRVTVHVAIGTDVVHHHAALNAAALGEATLTDFRHYCGAVADLGNGGVVINVGSAVILPEVFLKAVSISRNLGHPVQGFTAANMDMLRHYRPSENILGRPLHRGGRAIHLTGHHEIMIPLLHAMTLRAVERGRSGL
ncbi:hypothetical protein JXA88_12840 [Candidatus Fermentibacteria bacterium]|nr:hypothetical protein [Candidatus Fermentibacteria bacterium]